MSAVWRASRAAVRRRRLQTVVIGVVVGLSTTMIVTALGLLAASSRPFDQAYARQSGAHLVAAYDHTKVSDAELTEAARQPGVAAAAGPFGLISLDITVKAGLPPLPMTVVGRDDPGGAVDRLNLWQGHWVTQPGEIVLNQNPVEAPSFSVGDQVAVAGGQSLTLVGFAYTISRSADAWVTPAQMADLHPATTQMLYRFTDAATDAQIRSSQSAVTGGLPPGSLLSTQSYLPLKEWAAAQQGTFIPFLVIFGCLGLAVAVLIVANVVSGAVVAGLRHIGVLKALGFTPTQVVAVYLAMVSIPAVAGCVLGTGLGTLLATPLLNNAFKSQGSGNVGVAPWVIAVTLLGIPVVVALSALLPALRARSLSASEAISAGSAQRAGRGLRIQRWLAGTTLPRSVSLGLGLPFARPARSALTMAAVVLGVTSLTFALGLGITVTSYQRAQSRADAVQVTVYTGPSPSGIGAPTLSDTADESLLRSLPGAAHVTPSALVLVRQVGTAQTNMVQFYRGDTSSLGYQVLSGHWPNGPGEVAVSERFLRQRGVAVGDTLALEADGTTAQVRIVGKVLVNSVNLILSNWETLALVAPDTRAATYEIQLEPGTDVRAFMAAIPAGDPGLEAFPAGDSDPLVAIILATVSLLTLMLGTVTALGVFNTVVLNTRERRRDLGMLKSIGMTPRQVTLMVVTSMAALGAIGGLLGIPIGIFAHRLAAPAMAHAAQVAFPASMLNVYHAPLLALLALAGVAIAALGALIPARSAARVTIAEVLHNE